MLYYLLYPLADQFSLFNLFKYLTFRTGGAVLTALIFSFWFGPSMIRWLRKKQGHGQPIRDDGPESHLLTKKGTPTMGGSLILLALTISTLLWADLTSAYVWIALLVTLSYGLIGFIDDFLKVTKRNSKGLSGKLKLVAQVAVALAAAVLISGEEPDQLHYAFALPFFKNVLLQLGVFYLPVAAFVMVGASNAVNLTDGLDGLAIVPVMIVSGVFVLICYLTGHAVFANYLQIHHVPGADQLAVFCGALVGAGLGFLWFNAPPAMVFMGDTGSLAMGGALGAVSVVAKHEIVLAIAGGLFVLETVSVIVQVASFKMTGKRVFRMAPLHHHFEKKGWAEPTVVIRFWIISAILALVALSHAEAQVIMQALSTLYDGKTVAVMGLGKSGTSAARALAAAGAHVLAWDDQEETRIAAEAAGLPLLDLTTVDWSIVDLLVWSPGIPHTHPEPHKVAEAARAAGIKLVCDIDLLCAASPGARAIAITGTNGKSTTTTLTGHVLAGLGGPLAVGGNLGVPALDLPALGLDGTYVLELSSYQLELLDQARFDIAVLLNITPDHLARHGGMEGYVAAKASMFDRLPAGSVAIAAVDDLHAAEIHLKLSHRRNIVTRAISAQKIVAGGVYAPEGVLIDDLDGKAVEIIDLKKIGSLPGRHNWQNACAAYTIARSCGMSPEAIVIRLASYPGLKHRQELVSIIDGVRYVNDSKATNAEAAEKAIVCYDRIYWIAGGQAKEGGIESLRPLFPNIARAFLIGEAAQGFAETLSGAVGYEMCSTLEIAIHRARDVALADPHPAGGVVLLSPACASWDQFKSFEQRGDVFREIVNTLSGERSAA